MFDKWISSHRIRNNMMGDPILDWLELYGTQHGFKPMILNPFLYSFYHKKEMLLKFKY